MSDEDDDGGLGGPNQKAFADNVTEVILSHLPPTGAAQPSIAARMMAEFQAYWDRHPEEKERASAHPVTEVEECVANVYNERWATEATQPAIEAPRIAVLIKQSDEHFEKEGLAIVYQDSRGRFHLHTGFIDYIATEVSMHCTADAGEVERLRQRVNKFSTLADERHDLLCTERRANDLLREEQSRLDQALEAAQQRRNQLRAELSAAQLALRDARSWIADIEEREAAVCPEDVGFEEYIGSLKQELSDARANAIRECAKELRRRANNAASTGDHLPGTDRAKELHVEARALAQAATWLLESLTKKEGDGA